MGSIRGSAHDLGLDVGLESPLPPSGVRVEFSGSGGSASLDGVVSRGAYLSQGRIAGAIAFTDSQNGRASCAAIQWLMQPASGVLPTSFALFALPRRPYQGAE